MIFKQLPTVIFFIFLSGVCFSQQTASSLLALKNNKIKEAKYLIDSLTEIQANDKDAEIWFANGLIYETIYFSKDSLTRLLTKSPLLIAAESYQKSAAITPKNRYSTLAAKRLDSAVTKNLLFEGEKLEKHKKIEDAVSHLGLYSKMRPEDTTGLIRLAIAADKASQADLAIKSYRRLISLKYKTEFVYKSVFLLLKESKSFGDAKKILKEAILLYGKDEDWTKLEISLALDLGNTTEAIRKSDSAAIRYPQNKKVYLFNIGAIYDSKDQTDSAIVYYQKSLKEDSGFFDANYNLGGIYYQSARSTYTKINEMPYAEYQKTGKIKEEEGHGFSKLALPYFESCYASRKDESVKSLLKDIYRNLKLNSKLRELEK